MVVEFELLCLNFHKKLGLMWYNTNWPCFCPGSNPKKPSAPDMFTESDDMFAAYFDVSILSVYAGGVEFSIPAEVYCSSDHCFSLSCCTLL